MPDGAIRRISCSDPVESQELKRLIRDYTEKFDRVFSDGSDSDSYYPTGCGDSPESCF